MAIVHRPHCQWSKINVTLSNITSILRKNELNLKLMFRFRQLCACQLSTSSKVISNHVSCWKSRSLCNGIIIHTVTKFNVNSVILQKFINRNISSSSTQHFWEPDRKGGYYTKRVPRIGKKEMVREGLGLLRGEVSKWADEMKEKFEGDPLLIRPGDMDIVMQLDSEKVLENWIVTTDKDNNEGKSTAQLTLSTTGHGLFSGTIDTTLPKDGKIKKAGYCNITSKQKRRSFLREVCHDFTIYTHLVLRVRGDGRNYMVNLNTSGYFDVTWNDLYSYVLYTRGGPYWQVTKIPFSKFLLTSKGRVQDKQSPICLSRIKSIGITAGDRINAPFRLEIDYIGVLFDPRHTEEFAYEMYKVPRFMIGT